MLSIHHRRRHHHKQHHYHCHYLFVTVCRKLSSMAWLPLIATSLLSSLQLSSYLYYLCHYLSFRASLSLARDVIIIIINIIVM